MAGFDTGKKDSQSTIVEPVSPEHFPWDKYLEYEDSLLKRCEQFWNSTSGVLVYRRMRVAEVFSHGCRDINKSLEWQLGALKESMAFEADVPNFLEPWYGIGTTASAFDMDYIWNPGQAPAVKPAFSTLDEALCYPVKPVHQTAIGRHTLNMAAYFMEKTRGRMPMSYCDIQSPFNVAPNVVKSSAFFTEAMLNPGKARQLLEMLAELITSFTVKQREIIGDSLVYPGHGFASSRKFDGFGMSEDNIVMVDSGFYSNIVAPSFERLGNHFGGPVFHSCGDYSDKLEAVKSIPHLKMLDAAFSGETDPDPNPPDRFREGFVDSGVVVNARIVGDLQTIEQTVKRLWKPGMKLIVVTYCQTPEEQGKAYERIHDICTGA